VPLRQKERAVIIALWVLFMLMIVGVFGFYLIGYPKRSLFDSAWMTLQILTTVGDTGMDRTLGEKIFSAFLMLVGVMAVYYLGVNIVRFILEGELRSFVGRRHVESQIRNLNDHFIVCGFGRMGSALADALQEKRAKFVVLDQSGEAIREADEKGYLYVRGDAMAEETLEAVQVGRARGLAACLPTDSDNVYVVLTARSLNPELTIVSRANYQQTQSKLRTAGADHILSPHQLAADRALTKFMLPAVDELLEIVVHGPDLEVSKISLDKIPAAIDRPLRELELPARASVMVVAVVHADGQRTFNPSPDTTLRTGDELIIIAPEGGVQKMLEHYGPSEVR
jgi:voltage-gated potassium channel